jgi:uncharacterized protein with HEPN domain
MEHRELRYLEHIVESIDGVRRYAAEIGSLDALIKSPLYEDAVLRRIHVMAESMLELEEDTRQAMPEIPWKAIKNFRNLIVHKYLEVDMNKVWQLIQSDLPVLKTAVLRVMKEKYGK